MPAITLPAINLPSEIFARAGVAMLTRMANVQATIDGTPVAGRIAIEPAMPDLGGMAVQANNVALLVHADDLPPATAEGSVVTLQAADVPATMAAGRTGTLTYSVAQMTPMPALGLITLALERA